MPNRRVDMLPSLKLTANAPEKNGLLPQKEKFIVFHPIHFSSLRSVSFRDAVVARREPSLKLTARTWKWMVGRRSFPFGAGLFSGAIAVSFREGKIPQSFFLASQLLVIFHSRLRTRVSVIFLPLHERLQNRCRWRMFGDSCDSPFPVVKVLKLEA